MRKLILLFCLLLAGQGVFAQTPQQLVQPQTIDFNICNKYFKLDNHTLFYLTMSGLNENRFTIDEIKSRSGYILFTAAQKQYLASVITRCDF